MGFWRGQGDFLSVVPLKKIEYGVYGDLIEIYPKPCSIYLRGTIPLKPSGLYFVPLGLFWVFGPEAQVTNLKGTNLRYSRQGNAAEL